MASVILFFLLFSLVASFDVHAATSSCHLPASWTGQWYQGKEAQVLTIDRTHFLSRGACVEHRADKFLFYDAHEQCFRCIFVMQKHLNVLQFRSSKSQRLWPAEKCVQLKLMALFD